MSLLIAKTENRSSQVATRIVDEEDLWSYGITFLGQAKFIHQLNNTFFIGNYTGSNLTHVFSSDVDTVEKVWNTLRTANHFYKLGVEAGRESLKAEFRSLMEVARNV